MKQEFGTPGCQRFYGLDPKIKYFYAPEWEDVEIEPENGQFYKLTDEEGFLTNISMDKYEKALKAIGYL